MRCGRECLPSGQFPSIKYDGGNIIVRFPEEEEAGGGAGTVAATSDGSGGRTEILEAVYIAVKVGGHLFNFLSFFFLGSYGDITALMIEQRKVKIIQFQMG